jgi:hypothetical protein
MQFPPISCHFIFLRTKYSPEHPVLKHPQSTFFPLSQRPSFTPIQNHRQNYNSVYSNFYVFIQQTIRQKVLYWMFESITWIQSNQCNRILKYDIMNNLACKPVGDSMLWIRYNANNRILENIITF